MSEIIAYQTRSQGLFLCDCHQITRFWDRSVFVVIERFSIECRKTKTKAITLANHRGHRQSSEPIKTRSNYMKLPQSAGKREWVRIGFGFTSDWMKKWLEFFKPIMWRTKPKTNCLLTLKWKPLYRKIAELSDLNYFDYVHWIIFTLKKGNKE